MDVSKKQLLRQLLDELLSEGNDTDFDEVFGNNPMKEARSVPSNANFLKSANTRQRLDVLLAQTPLGQKVLSDRKKSK